jgi:hypothetical protein
MKTSIALAGFIFLAASVTLAKDAPTYDKGTLLSMDSSSCGTAEKDAKSVTGEILGTDSAHKTTEQVLCQEYVLQGERITYHIRPTEAKHPALLPVGEVVQYRINKDRLYLFDPEGDKKERAYSVVSMQVRADVKDAKNSQ